MDLSHPSFHGHYNELSISSSLSSSSSRVPDSKPRRNFSSSMMMQLKKQTLALKQGFKEVWLRSDDGHITLSSLKEQGGIGLTLALLSTTTSMAKDHINPLVAALCSNPTFVAGLMAWSLSQVMKVFTTLFVERRWDVGMLIGCGGMPSSHSALCVALTTSVAVLHGIGDALFPVCLGFTLIVMYDAIGVRRHAGMQAQVLNLIVNDRFQGHPVREKKLKEILGHTPLQVIVGAIVGIIVGYLCSQGYNAFPR